MYLIHIIMYHTSEVRLHAGFHTGFYRIFCWGGRSNCKGEVIVKVVVVYVSY